MLNAAVSVLLYFFELLVAYIVFSSRGERKRNTVITFAVGLVLFECGALINIVFDNTVWINSIYTLLSTFSFAVICFSIKPAAAAVYTVLMAIFSSSLEFTAIFAVSAIAGAEITDYNFNKSLLLLEISVSKSLYFISCLALSRISGNKQTAYKLPLSFCLLPTCILLSLLAFWYISVHEDLSYINQMLLSVISAALLCATVFLFISYRDNLERENEYIQIKSENERLQLEKEYYDILERQNKQLIAYTHDNKNHLAAIQNLSGEPRVNNYIEELLGRLDNYADNCRSGNKMLDVIIDRYAAKCDMAGIKFHYDVRNCNLSIVEDIDLVSILGNLMDNALTAAERSAEKNISLETDVRNSYNVITISNSCDSVPEINGSVLISTKKDSKLHGFGLKSVGKTLEKYHGDFDWSYSQECRRFNVTAIVHEIL